MNTVDAKFSVFNPRSISQAGRRGFESRLPLHFQQVTSPSKNQSYWGCSAGQNDRAGLACTARGAIWGTGEVPPQGFPGAADRTATMRLAINHDARLPVPGGLLAKEHKGETHVVKVLDNGFDYDGRLYRSLSAIAQEITGTKWNGYLFFGIAKEVAHGRRAVPQKTSIAAWSLIQHTFDPRAVLGEARAHRLGLAAGLDFDFVVAQEAAGGEGPLRAGLTVRIRPPP